MTYLRVIEIISTPCFSYYFYYLIKLVTRRVDRHRIMNALELRVNIHGKWSVSGIHDSCRVEM